MFTRRQIFVSVAGLLAASAANLHAAGDSSPAAPRAAIGNWGFDLAGRDLNVRPGDNFFRQSGGGWMDTNKMPSDRTRWGTFDQLAEKSEANVKAIVESLALAKSASGSVEQKIGDYYASFLDTATLDRLGMKPAQAALQSIRAARSHEDVARLIAKPDLPLAGPLGVFIALDQKDPDRYIVSLTHGGLGLPDREYYLKDDPQFKEIRAQYSAHIARLMQLAGQGDPAGSATRILALETAIAERHWPVAKRRQRELTYNLKTLSQLIELAPEYPWTATLTSAGIAGTKTLVVRELDTIAPLAKLFRATPVGTWREYLAYHFLVNTAKYLPSNVDAEVFDFYGHKLNGQPEQRPRWKRAVSAVNGSLGEAVGQVYVQRAFSAHAKQQVQTLVENLRRAYSSRFDQITWMTPETKLVAREKLAAFRPKIGFPDKWRDYSALQIKRGDAFGNALRGNVYEWNFERARLGKPSDRDEWGITPQTVNAYYNPVFNEVVFPAAILQAPFFDENADDAVNYGGIGGVIGHEMSHGFDDQGAKSDAKGVLRTWWNAADEKSFALLGDRLVEQYNGYEPLPGLHVNGRLCLGENIGDLGGLTVAHEAYRLALGGKTAAVLDGLSGEQRFFNGWAQVWRALMREQSLRNQVMTDPHSPAEYRVNGVVRNMDAWYEAFDVKPGDKLYLAPDQRIRIW